MQNNASLLSAFTTKKMKLCQDVELPSKLLCGIKTSSLLISFGKTFECVRAPIFTSSKPFAKETEQINAVLLYKTKQL